MYTTREPVNQRIEPSQPQLLDQTFIIFDYFERFEFSWFRATIMSFKVCRVVNAHQLIRAGEEMSNRKSVNPRSNIPNLDY